MRETKDRPRQPIPVREIMTVLGLISLDDSPPRSFKKKKKLKALEEKTTTVSSGYRFVASSQPILVRFRAFVRSPILLQRPVVRGSGFRLRIPPRLRLRLRFALRPTLTLMLGLRLLRAHNFLHKGTASNNHNIEFIGRNTRLLRHKAKGSLMKSPLRRTWRAARLNAASCSTSSSFSATSMSACISARRKSSCADATSRSDCHACFNQFDSSSLGKAECLLNT